VSIIIAWRCWQEALADSLRECREVVKFLELPAELQSQLAAAMHASGMYVPQSADEWFDACHALRGVWASKWTDRAFISVRNVGIDHGDLRMSVLVQVRASQALG
jgi:alpha-glucan,water dikinase